jgi:hypothetical protein
LVDGVPNEQVAIEFFFFHLSFGFDRESSSVGDQLGKRSTSRPIGEEIQCVVLSSIALPAGFQHRFYTGSGFGNRARCCQSVAPHCLQRAHFCQVLNQQENPNQRCSLTAPREPGDSVYSGLIRNGNCFFAGCQASAAHR